MKWSEYLLWINLDLTLNELFILRWFRLLIAYNNTMESLMKEARTKTKTTETKQTNVRMTNSPKTKTLARKWAKKIRINQSLSAISRVNYGFFCGRYNTWQKCQKVKLFIHRLYFKMKFAVHLSFFHNGRYQKVRKQKTKLMSLKRNWTFTLNPMPVPMLLLSHRDHLIAAFRIAFLLFTPNTFIITARKCATQPRISV